MQAPSIIGTWEMRTGYSGQGGSTDFPAGNGKIFKFTNTDYARYDSGVIQNSGTYAIVKDTSGVTGEPGYRIIFDNQQNAIRIFITLSGNTFSLTVDAYDGPSVVYARIDDF